MKNNIFYNLRAMTVMLMFVALMFVIIVSLFGCKKESCYTCSTSDNGTGYIWDVEYLCGESDATDYINTFNDVNNTAECIMNE
ncbi:MAG: hypothetical protein IH845_04800 [Nanoarchaeota archaeon]|nr:hypothetical protein [Nanoarchaeota archaeon]